MEYLFLFVFICLSIALIQNFFSNPYVYPYYAINIDVSGKRNVQMRDMIEMYILENGVDVFKKHQLYLNNWKNKSKFIAESSIFRNHRLDQYNQVLDDEHVFVFNLLRNQVRYKQENYVKTSYSVKTVAMTFSCSYDEVMSYYNDLLQIGFETTTSKYNMKNQRKLLTKELREKIKVRDNYTCQHCGKYMPDGVGLHIDHIIPVSKNGKSVESNLQVLCSICNGRKSNK